MRVCEGVRSEARSCHPPAVFNVTNSRRRLVESYEFLKKIVAEGEELEGVGDGMVGLSEDVMGVLKYLEPSS